jgi:hypothetical protein
MKDEQQHHGNGFFIGFILGILAMFLLGTKKGREIVQSLTKNGSTNLSMIKEAFDDPIEDDMENETDFVKERPIGSHIQHEKYPTHGRKFFRRLRKE